ncbi:Unknown protein sequence [Pseudomonas syringae pv. aceris]|nr:Unknown protein sequence [Pseudomonas syringae pv. aceris]
MLLYRWRVMIKKIGIVMNTPLTCTLFELPFQLLSAGAFFMANRITAQ